MQYVLCGVGQDRPGVLDDLNQQLVASRVQLRQVRTFSLHGAYAMALMVDLPDDFAQQTRDQLLAAINGKSGGEFKLFPATDAVDPALHRLSIETTAVEKSLGQVGNLLRVLKVNIDDVESEPGRLTLYLALPATMPQQKLHELLGQLLTADTAWSLELA